MEYRRMGRTGLHLSALSLGSWVTFKNQVDLPLAKKMMVEAYEVGVNFFDNAEAYAGGESEVIMGKALNELGWGRDTYCVSSKVFWGGNKPTQRGLNRKHVVDACHAALKRFQLDYLDLYFCHRPDVETPIEETVWAMNDLIRQGKVLYWGTSEWSAQQITEAHRVAKENHLLGPSMEQPEYNLFHRQKVEVDYQPIYETYGLGTTIWSPLASGILSGKYTKGIPSDSRPNLPGYQWLKEKFESAEGKQKILKSQKLNDLAQDLNMSLAQMSLAWCLLNSRVSTVILGASKVEQLKENLKAQELVALLTPEIQAKIETIADSRPERAEIF